MLWKKLAGAFTPNTNIQYVGGRLDRLATTANTIISLTPLTGGIESAPAAGDFVLVYFGVGSFNNANVDMRVNGYTEIADLFSNDLYDANLAVAYKFMSATPDTSFTLIGGTGDVASGGAVAVQVWRGVNATTPLDVTSQIATGINTVLCNPPAITPITAGAVIVAGGAGAHINGTQTYSSSDLDGFITIGTNDARDVTTGVGYKFWSSGAFDPAQFTFSADDSSSNAWAAVTLALRPAT